MQEVAFVIPCLNEERTIGKVIERCKSAGKFFSSFEIIVVDNGSIDDSIKISKNLGARVVIEKVKGYGSALKRGIKEAKANYIIMGDADDTYDFLDSVVMIDTLRNDNCDLIIGNRLEGNIEKGAMPVLHKYLGNPILSFIGRLLFLIDIKDFHCGLRAFKRESIINLNLRSSGMEFASEMIIRASLSEYKIKQTPVKLKVGIEGRKPHLRTWRDGWRHLKFMFFFTPKYSYLSFSFISLLVSFILFSLYLLEKLPFSGVNTLLFSTVFYIFSLWFLSEYTSFRVLFDKNIKYNSTKIGNFIFKKIGNKKLIDKLFQSLFFLITLSLILTIFLNQKRVDEIYFLSSRKGNLYCFFLMILNSTSLFIYLLAIKLGTIDLLTNKKD